MLTPSLNTVMTRLLIVAAVLVALMFIASASFAQEGPIEYDENGTDVVITFTSTDPENGTAGAGIDWDVTGLDADDFYIDAVGNLMFRSPPDYENPTDRAVPDDTDTADVNEEVVGDDNMYQITVRATEQATDGDDVRALSTETDVTVSVMDVDEDGEASLNMIQPQVGTGIIATLTDPDGTSSADTTTDVNWQWYVSKVTNPVDDAPDHWVAAAGTDAIGTGVSNTYTPKGERVTGTEVTEDPADSEDGVDEGKYLRAVATYNDRLGTAREAIIVSMNPVEAEVSSDRDGASNPENGSPGFSSQGDYERTVSESLGSSMPVGAPVVATDPNDDTLTYQLDVDLLDEADGAENDEPGDEDQAEHVVHNFSIDWATGQISVAAGKKLDYDSNMDGYTIFVRATDPSGETAHVEVTVTVTGANDAPVIRGSLTPEQIETNEEDNDPSNDAMPPVAPSELRVDEKDDGYDGSPGLMVPGVLGNDNIFTAIDEDARGQITWSVRGEDADEFALTSTSADPTTGLRGPGEPITLRFAQPPDYENPTDANSDSVYKVTLVATDSADAEDTRDLTIFVDNVEEQGSVSLVTADPGQPLIGDEVTAEVSDPDNGLAVVTWQWLRSETGAAGSFEVIPGATTGSYTPVDDDNGYFLMVRVTYTDITSEMDDPVSVLVDERTQNKQDPTSIEPNVAAALKAPIDGDGEDTEGGDTYRVTSTSANAVRVAPGDAPVVNAPEFAMAAYELTLAENAEIGSLVGNAIRVMPEKDKTFTYTLSKTVTDDNSYFMIDPDYGQIRVKAVLKPNPTPADMIAGPTTGDYNTATGTDPVLNFEGDNTFSLIVTASEVGNSSRRAAATVNITLTDVNERPYFDKDSRERVMNADGTAKSIMYAETRTNLVVPLAGVEPDGDELDWVVTGPDASDFMIVDADDINDGKDRVELHFRSQPDFEDGKGSVATDDTGNTYMVTVRSTEKDDGPNLAETLDVTVQVINSDESGIVELTWLRPEVTTPQSASIVDPDGNATGPSWQWYRAKVDEPADNPDPDSLTGEWELIAAATSETYTPDEADVDVYLLVRAEYTDPQGSDKNAVGVSMYKVRAEVADEDNNSPDFHRDTAVRDIDEDASEGDAIGAAVDVDRNEDNDVLTYQIFGDAAGATTMVVTIGTDEFPTDLSFFSIDKDTGQIRVKKTLSAEPTDDRNYDEGTVDQQVTAGVYKVFVRATDPTNEEGGENNDNIEVTVNAMDVNEAPGVTGLAELAIDEENSSSEAGDVTKFVALGYELTGQAPDQTVQLAANDSDLSNLYKRTEEDELDVATWPDRPIAGPDGHLFEYSVPSDGIGRRLHFKSPPNFEDPMDANRDNVYEVTITVVDTEMAMGSKDIRITVENVDEMGTLTLLPEQPDDGMPVIAMVEDPDGVVTITNWKWASTTVSTLTDFPATAILPGATMDRHTGEVGQFLWAMVDYRDGASRADDPVTALDERNYNDEGAHIGVEVDGTATDDTDVMLEKGTDRAIQPDPDDDDETTPPSSGVEMFTIMVDEDVPSTGYVGLPIQDLGPRNEIGGPDGSTFVFAESEDDDPSTFYDLPLQGPVQGPDDDDTTMDVDEENDKMGQLALAPVTHLDYEGSKKTYTIEITDPDAEKEISTYRITVVVVDVNEPPTAPSELKGLPPALNTAPMFLVNGDVATSTYRMVAENTAAGMDIGDPVMATDSDRGDQETVMYMLGGADMASFTIDSATGQLSTSAPLDYETKSEFMVTVTATDDDDASATITVTISVTDEVIGGKADDYDADKDEMIDGGEVLLAVRHYFDGLITGPEVLEVVGVYFQNF